MTTTIDEIVDAIYLRSSEPPQFVSAQDIADEVGCTIQTVHNKKEEVVARAEVESTKIGQATVFYRNISPDSLSKCFICDGYVREADRETATIIVNSIKSKRGLCPDCSQSLEDQT